MINSITPLKTSDTGSFALNLMDELKVSHLPIVNDTAFLGLISDSDINNSSKPDEPIGNHKLSMQKTFIEENQHIYDVIKLMTSLKLTLVPVLDHKNNYLGAITLARLAESFSLITSVSNPGGIITLELNTNDYNLTEISHIIESNNTKILSLYITSHIDSTKLEVTIKTNKIDIAPVLQALRRYNYNIKASFSEESDLDYLQDRFNSFMNYLNI